MKKRVRALVVAGLMTVPLLAGCLEELADNPYYPPKDPNAKSTPKEATVATPANPENNAKANLGTSAGANAKLIASSMDKEELFMPPQTNQLKKIPAQVTVDSSGKTVSPVSYDLSAGLRAETGPTPTLIVTYLGTGGIAIEVAGTKQTLLGGDNARQLLEIQISAADLKNVKITPLPASVGAWDLQLRCTANRGGVCQ